MPQNQLVVKVENTAGRISKSGCQSVTQGSKKLKTAEKLALQFGVSARTIYRAARFAQAVDIIGETVGPEAKSIILAGKSGFSSAEIVRISKLPRNVQAQRFATAKQPRAKRGSATFDAEEAVARIRKFVLKIAESAPRGFSGRLSVELELLIAEINGP